MSELVTGEAVALEMRPARLPSRALAVLLDLAVAMTAYVVVSIGLLAATASLDEAAQIALSIATFLLVLVGGPIAVETLSHGRSLGKLACGLRVVRDDGGPIRFRHALVRGAIGVVEILMTFGVVACIASLVSGRGRRLGDVFAGTLVVRERVPAGQASFVPPPPPWLAGRFSALDLSAVPDGLWLAIRQYLTRMRQLDPQVGSGMAERLAVDLSTRTGAPVPPGVPPAMYLAAVLQERQVREARRAFGNGTAAGGPGAQAFPTPQVSAPTPQSSAPAPQAPAYPAPSASAFPAPQAPAPSAPRPEPARGERPATGFVPPA
ncbi:RDD family protein [Streptomyces spiralis]|uniref:RDD family protein n=1 Tax=Streptomyces spiralis TaxID=66376 RepID=UPI00340B6280